jgi:hypothetical protein
MISARTRPEPRPAKSGRLVHIYPYDWKGERLKPNCTGLTGDWGGVRPGNRMPEPGDIFLIHAGAYQGIRNHYP